MPRNVAEATCVLCRARTSFWTVASSICMRPPKVLPIKGHSFLVTLALAMLSLFSARAAAAACTNPQSPSEVQSCIWNDSSAPTVVDGGATGAMEVGVKFTVDTSGYITGIRFYKAATNTGTHVGNLWSSSGTLLATATFASETASGWQEVSFPSPVLISANTTYVASYHSNTGHVSDDANYFANIGVDNAPLHTPPSGTSGGNGVYILSASSAFPNLTNLADNYWVDVAYQAQATVPGLVAYWKFDDGSGASAADSSGNGHTASLFNGVTWVAGKIGDGVSAGGTNQYVSIPAIDLSTTKAVTVAFWLNHTYSTSGGHTLLEDTANFNSSTTGFGFFPDDSSCNGIMTGVHGDVGYTINCYAQPSSGVWHHIAAIYDKSQVGSNEVALYIDGVLQTPKQNYLTSNNTNTFGSNPIYLFSRGGTQEYSAGVVDDLRIYSLALLALQIQQLYDLGAGSPALVSIAVTPANPSIVKGTTQQFTATGTYSDNSTQNITGSVTWSSGTTSVATVTAAGLATGTGAGTSTIQATSGSVSGSTVLTVTPPVLVSIAVTPANSFVAKGGTQQYTATGTYSDNSTQNLTGSVTWSSTSTAVATITSGGLATGVATGSTTIQASSGSISGTTGLTVTAALVSIAVTPANASIVKAGTQQYTATGTYSDNSTQNLTGSVTWSSTNTAAATITSGGLATGVSTGSTTIQASSGSINGTTGLTVTAPVLMSIAVTPANASMVKGGTQQYAATGTYSDNSTQNLTGSVTWSSTSTAAATITSGGLATGVAAGSTTIQATLGSVSGSTGLTVTAFLPGLVGYWKFDDGTGTTAVDSSGNGYTATLANGVTWTTGKIGDAVAANGTNQYVSMPAINLSATQAVTVAFWLNHNYSTAGGTTLEDTANFNSSTTGFGFFPDDPSCNGIMTGVHGDAGYTINCYTQPSSGVWHHVAAIYDKSQVGSNEVALYIDGVLQTPKQNYLSSNNTNTFGNNPIYLFSRGGTQEYSAGQIDDLQIYNRALSASEVQHVYDPSGPPPTLLITLSPGNVPGGGTSTGTIRLGTPAPSGGAVVTLASNNTAVATVPTSVTVPSGLTSVEFTVATNPVASSTVVTISGTYGVTQTTNLTVVPAVGTTGQFVQWASCDAASATTSRCNQDGNAQSGNLILVFSHWDNQTLTASVTDTLGNHYVPIGAPVNVGSTHRFQAWYAKNVVGGAPLGVTVTYSGQTLSFSLVDVIEYSGLDKNSPLDVFAISTGSGTSQDSGPSPMTTANNETIVGLFGYASYANPYTAGTGFTFHQYDATSMLEDKPVTATGTYDATASSTVATNWAAFVIAFRNGLQSPVMSQRANDNFNRPNASTLGSSWTPLVGVSANVPTKVVNGQVVSSALSPSVGKELFYGGLNWPADQYSEVQIVNAVGNGYEGPAVRMTSNDTHYACLVYNVGTGNATVGIVFDNSGTYSTLATSTTATVNMGDTIRCSVQGSNLTMTDQTALTTLLTATDSHIPAGYPGLVNSAGTVATTNYVLANWAAGSIMQPLVRQQLASDNFNRSNSPNLGTNWAMGVGHCNEQIVNNQIAPGSTPSGCAYPAKEHYTALTFPNDQWSEGQVVTSGASQSAPSDNGMELRYAASADQHYLTDVNVTGPAGTAETRIVRVDNGTPTALVVDTTYSAVAAGDYIIGQVQGGLISMIDATTGTLLLTINDSAYATGNPGWSLNPVNGTSPVGANWSGGTFH